MEEKLEKENSDVKDKKVDKILEYLIYILFFMAPLTRSGVNVFSYLILLIWVYKRVRYKDKLDQKYSALKPWFVIYGTVMVLSLFNTVHVVDGLRNLFSEYIKYVVVFVTTLELIREERQFRKIWTIVPVSALLFVGYGFYEYYYQGVRRIFVTFSNPNPAGSYVMLMTVLALAAVLFSKARVYKLTGLLFTVAGSWTLGLSGSRGAMVGFICGVTVLLFTFGWRSVRVGHYRRVVVVLVVVLVVAFMLVPQDVVERIGSSTNLEGSSIQQRFIQYRVVGRMVRDYPLVGIGTGQFRDRFPDYITEEDREKVRNINIVSRVHSLYFNILAETGILGLLAFLILLGKVFWLAVKGLKNWQPRNLWFHYGVMGLVVGLGVHNLFDWTFLHTQVGIFVVILVAVWMNNIYRVGE
ncbi:MAG: O-antigen ligase family protein [Bacillota bacterium]